MRFVFEDHLGLNKYLAFGGELNCGILTKKKLAKFDNIFK